MIPPLHHWLHSLHVCPLIFSPLIFCPFFLSTYTLACLLFFLFCLQHFQIIMDILRLIWFRLVWKGGIKKESVGRRESVRWRISWISFHFCQEALVFSHFLFYSGRCFEHPPSNECVPASVDTHTHTHTHTHRRWVCCSGSCRHFRLRLNWGVGSSGFFSLSVGVFSELAFK